MRRWKIPDEYVSGSKPLVKDREELALGLVTLAHNLAHNTLENRDFRETLGFNNLEDKEHNRIILELVMFNLFVISWWMSRNFKDNPTEILDRMYYHFKYAISENDMEFAALTEERSRAYYDALSNKTGAGGFWWFGKEATQYILGKEITNDDHELITIAMKSIEMFNQIMWNTVDSVKAYVTRGNSKGIISFIKRLLG